MVILYQVAAVRGVRFGSGVHTIVVFGRRVRRNFVTIGIDCTLGALASVQVYLCVSYVAGGSKSAGTLFSRHSFAASRMASEPRCGRLNCDRHSLLGLHLRQFHLESRALPASIKSSMITCGLGSLSRWPVAR